MNTSKRVKCAAWATSKNRQCKNKIPEGGSPYCHVHSPKPEKQSRSRLHTQAAEGCTAVACDVDRGTKSTVLKEENLVSDTSTPLPHGAGTPEHSELHSTTKPRQSLWDKLQRFTRLQKDPVKAETTQPGIPNDGAQDLKADLIRMIEGSEDPPEIQDIYKGAVEAVYPPQYVYIAKSLRPAEDGTIRVKVGRTENHLRRGAEYSKCELRICWRLQVVNSAIVEKRVLKVLAITFQLQRREAVANTCNQNMLERGKKVRCPCRKKHNDLYRVADSDLNWLKETIEKFAMLDTIHHNSRSPFVLKEATDYERNGCLSIALRRGGVPADADKLEFENAISNAEDEGWNSVYTDRSRIDYKTGLGTYTKDTSTSTYLGEQTTVNDAELIAMSEALRNQAGELLIITDSKGEPTHKGPAKLVRDAWKARTDRGDWDVAVMWVKSHIGVRGNTEADTAAKIGTCLPYQDETITEDGIRQTSRHQRATERNRLGLSYRPLTRLGTRHIATLAGILGGKLLRKWQYEIGKADSPECRWCEEEEETTEHVLTRCRTWKRKWPGGMQDLVTPPKSKDIDPLRDILE
ncbi:hypothetical protein BDZ91DRAFT_797911 [Kalaharituber pfeilii]|nr:hypothetical protein BDZ91DRAFT_797911 [Kalaharituber pfeilii]